MKAFCRKYIIFIYRVNIQTHIKTNHDPEKQSTTPHNPSRKSFAHRSHINTYGTLGKTCKT